MKFFDTFFLEIFLWGQPHNNNLDEVLLNRFLKYFSAYWWMQAATKQNGLTNGVRFVRQRLIVFVQTSHCRNVQLARKILKTTYRYYEFLWIKIWKFFKCKQLVLKSRKVPVKKILNHITAIKYKVSIDLLNVNRELKSRKVVCRKNGTI